MASTNRDFLVLLIAGANVERSYNVDGVVLNLPTPTCNVGDKRGKAVHNQKDYAKYIERRIKNLSCGCY